MACRIVCTDCNAVCLQNGCHYGRFCYCSRHDGHLVQISPHDHCDPDLCRETSKLRAALDERKLEVVVK